MSISIFTITHVPFTPPTDPIYVPLQVGRINHPDYGYLGDDTGDNISAKNPYYSELTGLYWIWKNKADSDYLGLCHYRRYFLNDSGELMQESEYESILSEYDVMVSQSRLGAYDYKTIYSRSHDIRNLELTEEVIRELYPDYITTFQEVIADNRCYVGNLFVAPKELFCSYCEWLFSIFFAMEDRIDTSGYDDYHKRLFGFLSEQLLIVWIKHNHLSYYETPFGISQEKAETIELKEQLRNDFKSKDIHGAYKRLCDTLDKRPDLLLEMSDFNQELRTIEHILNVCRIELENKLPTLLTFSDDLDLLVKHFNLLVQIIGHIQDGSLSEQELQYLLDCQVSYKAIIYIMQNFKNLAENPLILLNQLAVLYTNAGNPLNALSFLEEALNICDTDVTTLQNAAIILEQVESPSLRIVLFTGSDIPILEYIAAQYRNALESLGHTVLTFDKQNFEKSMEQLFVWQKQGIDASIVFNNACFQMRMQSGESLWDLWKIPCFNLLVDHPMYYADTLDHAPDHGIVVCADRYHTDYCKQFYPTVKNTIFLPTAGECLKPFTELKPFDRRSIEVLFIGSYKYHADVVYNELDKQLENELLTHPDKTFVTALKDCLQTNKIQLSEQEFKVLVEEKRFVDVNTTALFRLRMIEGLVKNDIRVTIYGDGWENLEVFHHPNFIFKGTISPEDGIALMEDAKIVLNQLAWFKAGASERIFEAMLQGAVSLTDDSKYLREQFTDGEDIQFFSLEHLEKLPELVRNLLTDTTRSERIRINAYEKAAAYHTWESRAKELLSFLNR